MHAGPPVACVAVGTIVSALGNGYSHSEAGERIESPTDTED
jgi:hypothetical protein